MDEGDGLRVSAGSEGDTSGLQSTSDTEDDVDPPAFSKTPQPFNSTPSRSVKMILKLNNINGDCVEKQSVVVASSSNNSYLSDSLDVSRDSEDVSRCENESTDNTSKSSSDVSYSQLNYSQKCSSSPHRSNSIASDSSDDDESDNMSDSDENSNSRVETLDTQPLLSSKRSPAKYSSMEVDEAKKDESGDYSISDDSFKKEDNSNLEPISLGDKLDVTNPDSSSPNAAARDESFSDGGGHSANISESDMISPSKMDSATILSVLGISTGIPNEISESTIGSSDDNSSILGSCNPLESQKVTEEEEETTSDANKEETTMTLRSGELKNNNEKSVDLPEIPKSDSSEINASDKKIEVDNSNEEIKQVKMESDVEMENVADKQAVPKPLEIFGGSNISINEMSIVQPCISSCFPKIESEPKISCEIPKTARGFSIRYKGYKKAGGIMKPLNFKKYLLRWNPFNPARKKDPKSGKYLLQRNICEEIASLQPEYAQYLGLQPIVKFKCSYCGLSNFQSMSALNTHKIECKKYFSKGQPLGSDLNKAITIRRRVYMCSVCGSYKPRSEFFQHMLKVHKLYICLFDKCLKFFQNPDALMNHFRELHHIEPKNCPNSEVFNKELPPNFYLLCVTCKKVFTDMDDPSNHSCLFQPSLQNENVSNNSDSDQLYQTSNQPCHPEPGQLPQNWEMPRENATLTLNPDITLQPIVESENTQRSAATSENIQPKETLLDSVAAPTSNPTDSLNIKVPSDIEIKPLIPGESQQEIKETVNESSIEIFPIPSTTQNQALPEKRIRKVRTVIRKTIKKKKIIVGKKKKLSETPSISMNTDISENVSVPPLSPPVIAPPPIVRSPEPEPPKPEPPPSVDPTPMEMEEPAGGMLREEPSAPQPPVSEDKPPSPRVADLPSIPPIGDIPERYDDSHLKIALSQDIFKIKLRSDLESDVESDDSQKLSLVVDENTNNSEDFKKEEQTSEQEPISDLKHDEIPKHDPNDVPLASDEIPAMALTLDDKIINVPIQAVLKECVRTSCMSCNYCRHAVKIAVNGKQLAIHLLSEHRYTPVKNETNDDVIRKLKSSLDILQNMYFNAETYDSSDPSIHVPYDKESNFDCFQCSYASPSHKDLLAHKRKFHTKSLSLCIMCKKNFFSYSELICHLCPGTYFAELQVYSVGINFRCCFCKLDTIPSAFRLMVHLRKSHHTCDICLEVCSDQQKLSTHMWKHKLNHLCYRCGIAYGSKPDITKHLFWKHGTESVLCKKCLQKKWPHVYHFCIPPTSFICEECNTSFSKAVALKVHKRIHGNDYPYACPQCEKKYVSKKLLSRHIDRHNAPLQKKDSKKSSDDENKDEIINVTDIDNKDSSPNEHSDSNKDGDGKEKSHKKHKKEKEKKDKKVVDVYDLPPLNLSSESDSSDDECNRKTFPKTSSGGAETAKVTESNDVSMAPGQPMAPDMPKLDSMLEMDDKSVESTSFLNLLKQDENVSETPKSKLTASEPVSPLDSSVVSNLLPISKDEMKSSDPIESMQNDHIDGIWENFYKTNMQNSNLPFPLCAMKTEVAYKIIMGDHDYCQVAKVEPTINEDLPSTSNMESQFAEDKLNELPPLIPEKPQTPPPLESANKEAENNPTPSKKKLKSPKKKAGKTGDDKNSSSSSDSSSDSDSSCSCATNCSCSSSSDSSSSSSSDSDSSTNEDNKKDKRKKKKEKKTCGKSDKDPDGTKTGAAAETEEEARPRPAPEDPPIRESELETDETTSDEEFYDRQPQIIANQLLAEKREKQIGLGAPVNNGGNSPLPIGQIVTQESPTPPPTPLQPLVPQLPPVPLPIAQENIPPPEQVLEAQSPKQKPRTPRTQRKRRSNPSKRMPKSRKPLLSEPSYPKFLNEPKSSPFSLFQQSPTAARPKFTPPQMLGRSPSFPEPSGSGSETDSTRLSKRRRVPNKFYGYSSGEEEDRPSPKWRKTEVPLIKPPQVATPKLPPTIIHPPPTPRIQLTVPKQLIRKFPAKPMLKSKSGSRRPRPPVTSDSSDSGSDFEERILRPPSPPPGPARTEKDVYCYCRCPYDEVSEMIACDDSNCKIEWFHFECVGILVPPRGQWYCPDCRKARGLPT